MRITHSPEQVEALTVYVALLQQEMRLTHWDVEIPVRSCGRSHLARVVTTPGRYVATLSVGPTFWRRSREEQRHTLTHELIHLVHVHVTDSVRVGRYMAQLGQTLYDHLYAEVIRHVEFTVDHIANLLAPTLSLPEWPRGVAA